MKRLRKGRLYLVRFFDHSESKEDPDPEVILNIVGKYVGQKKRYLIFCNWFADGGEDEDVIQRANVLKKAVIEIRELT